MKNSTTNYKIYEHHGYKVTVIIQDNGDEIFLSGKPFDLKTWVKRIDNNHILQSYVNKKSIQ